MVEMIALFVVGALGLSAAVSRPVGLLEAGASGVATSVCIFIAKIFAMASNSVTFLLFVNKFTVSADHHVSASVITCVDAGLEGIVANSEVGTLDIACYVSRLVCKVEFEIFHAFLRRGD